MDKITTIPDIIMARTKFFFLFWGTVPNNNETIGNIINNTKASGRTMNANVSQIGDHTIFLLSLENNGINAKVISKVCSGVSNPWTDQNSNGMDTVSHPVDANAQNNPYFFWIIKNIIHNMARFISKFIHNTGTALIRSGNPNSIVDAIISVQPGLVIPITLFPLCQTNSPL